MGSMPRGISASRAAAMFQETMEDGEREKPRDICGIGDCDTCPDTDCKQHPCHTDDPAYWEK
jgi:hypothetical protein